MSVWGVLGSIAGGIIGGPAGAALGGALGGGLDQSSSVDKAAQQQKAGTDAAIAENRRQYDTTRADYAPYREAGVKALGTYASENDTPLDQSQIQLDPGYQFGLTQGQQAIDRKTAASGGRISGAALKEAAQYGTDYATTGYGTAYARANSARNDRLERLRTLAGLGATTTSAAVSAGQDTTRANNAIVQAAGNNAGAATVAQGNIWGNAGNQIAALYGRNTSGTSPVVEGATNQTGNFDYYGTGYSP